MKSGVHKRLRSTPKQNPGPAETLRLLKRLLKTPEEKAEPVEDLAGIRKLQQTPKETGANKRQLVSQKA